MANELVVLDGFRYEIEHGELMKPGQLDRTKIVKVTFHDDARGVSVETWWPQTAWEEFRRDVNGGIAVAGRDEIQKLGI